MPAFDVMFADKAVMGLCRLQTVPPVVSVYTVVSPMAHAVSHFRLPTLFAQHVAIPFARPPFMMTRMARSMPGSLQLVNVGGLRT